MSKRILIADDSVTIQKAFAMTFAAEDVTLLAARSPDEGLSLARQSRPDLVIADVSMGARTGYDFCRALKADPFLAHVPVYLLGSVHNPIDPAGLRGCAADGELTKPFDSIAMIGQVREALAKGPIAAAAPPVADGVPESAADVASATLEVPPDALPGLSDDYGEIAIEASGPNDGFETTAVAGLTPPPEKFEQHPEGHLKDEEVATPPPVVRSPSPAPRQAAAVAAPAAGHAGAPAPVHVAPFSAPPTAPQGPSHPAAWQAPVAHPTGASPGGGMRPSLIPGLRPGILPSAGASARAFTAGRPAGAQASPAAPPSVGSPAPSHAPQPSASVAASHPAGGPGTLGPGATHVGRGGAPPVPMVTPASARTLVGMPAVTAQAPVRPANQPSGIRPGALAAPGFPPSGFGGPQPAPAVSQAHGHVQGPLHGPVHLRGAAGPAVSSAATASAPGSLFPLASPAPSGAGAGVVAALSSGASSVLGSKVDQKLAAIAARGPEYEAIAKLSREIIEKVVWEVVPELAEAIIREELSKRGRI
jgi:CheY-like chemotaxis protein